MSLNIDTRAFRLLEARCSNLEEQIEVLKSKMKENEQEGESDPVKSGVSIICFSGEWDRLFAALTIASGSLAMGMEVHIFFTFWSVCALRSGGKPDGNNKSVLQSMFNRMTPSGLVKAPLSKFNCWGVGKWFLKRIMKKQGVEDIDKLYEEVKDLGGHFHICDTSTSLFGLTCTEMTDGDRLNKCGVATFLSQAVKSRIVLFI